VFISQAIFIDFIESFGEIFLCCPSDALVGHGIRFSTFLE